MKEQRERERAAEIHLEFEIEVAAGAVTNPVGLHGFDTIPLWEVCQGVQERLGNRDKDKRSSLILSFFLFLHKFWKDKIFY